jgi:hypothetical protein
MDMNFQVWQRDNPTFRDDDAAFLAQTFPFGFSHVADVVTDDIGRVFQLTNHIDAPFWENSGVSLVKDPCRSTSVGDVIVQVAGPYGDYDRPLRRVTVNGFGLGDF